MRDRFKQFREWQDSEAAKATTKRKEKKKNGTCKPKPIRQSRMWNVMVFGPCSRLTYSLSSAASVLDLSSLQQQQQQQEQVFFFFKARQKKEEKTTITQMTISICLTGHERTKITKIYKQTKKIEQTYKKHVLGIIFFLYRKQNSNFVCGFVMIFLLVS